MEGLEFVLFTKGADEVANGAKTVLNEDEDPTVHVYKMSDEVDELFAGDLSGESLPLQISHLILLS